MIEVILAFLSSVRRLNVSVTRAKNALVILVDRDTLMGNEGKEGRPNIWRLYLSDFIGKGCVVDCTLGKIPDFYGTVSSHPQSSISSSQQSQQSQQEQQRQGNTTGRREETPKRNIASQTWTGRLF
eukprot:gnl/Chilomastix_caulleri/4046.p1 GENE.gnl/Chilomastix_caulleri/4046~~gnl/Chilomastix_caulleri/4046.p1  ORF type:complete len:126 (+),score=26.52 gnl/Chilomastix_caulleri/4046:155-532(+)